MIVEPVEKRGKIAIEKVPGVIWINPFTQNTVEEVMKETDNYGADVVITATSVPSVHTEAQIIAAKMGRISLFGGLPGEGKGHLDSNLIHYKELQVCRSSCNNSTFYERDYKFNGRRKVKPWKICRDDNQYRQYYECICSNSGQKHHESSCSSAGVGGVDEISENISGIR